MASMCIQIRFDGRDRPIAVSVEHIAPVAFVKQGGIETDVVIRGRRVVRPRLAWMGLRPRAYADLAERRFAGCLRGHINGIGIVHQ